MSTNVNHTPSWHFNHHLHPLPTPIPTPETWRRVREEDIVRAAAERYGVPLLSVTPDMAHAEYARLLALAGYAPTPTPDLCPLAIDEAARLMGKDATEITAADVETYYAYTDDLAREVMANG